MDVADIVGNLQRIYQLYSKLRAFDSAFLDRWYVRGMDAIFILKEIPCDVGGSIFVTGLFFKIESISVVMDKDALSESILQSTLFVVMGFDHSRVTRCRTTVEGICVN